MRLRIEPGEKSVSQESQNSFTASTKVWSPDSAQPVDLTARGLQTGLEKRDMRCLPGKSGILPGPGNGSQVSNIFIIIH